VSRSGTTISTGLLRGFERAEAARYSFLLGIPAIAGAGLLKGIELAGEPGGITAAVFVGLAVAAISGYAAIALLLRLIGRIGLVPFGIYCLAMGALALVVV
jgi:undecaprenyl-diphosphatase